MSGDGLCSCGRVEWHEGDCARESARPSEVPPKNTTPEPVDWAAVDHPAHYNVGGVEVIDAIEAWGLGFHLGNAVKYIARADHKGKRLEDLRKAAWYLDREIERRGGE